jgi:Fic family protein
MGCYDQVSIDIALRDISDLVEKGVLKKSEASGRITSYELAL